MSKSKSKSSGGMPGGHASSDRPDWEVGDAIDDKDPHARGKRLISRRHPEWQEFQVRWRWLLDSYEGGQRYRTATYGWDRRGMPIYNLIRHKREYPDPHELPYQYGGFLSMNLPPGMVMSAGAAPGQIGADASSIATDDDFEMRRARTPPPAIVSEVIECHLSEIFSQEIVREGTPELESWWRDVNGQGTDIDDWMQDEVAPLLYLFGMLDLMFDHPPAPAGAQIATQADVQRYKLNRVVSSYVLPQNIPWWSVDDAGRYSEVIIQEYIEEPNTGLATLHYRHWTPAESTLYNSKGMKVGGMPHAFGVIPIVRVFDRRKARLRHVGQSRVETIAELQREFYNRDSELVLSDSTQAHPLLQGPEDFIQADGTIPIGPSWLLPKKKTSTGTSATYEGFDIVDFPKDGAESIRQNKYDLRDAIDRHAHLTKPAGAAGTNAKTVSQSGVSKQLDHKSGNRLLAKLSAVFARLERTAAEFALIVAYEGDRKKVDALIDPDGGTLKVAYPASFDLFDAPELAALIDSIQNHLAMAGQAPLVEGSLIKDELRQALPGREDEEYEAWDEEIDLLLASKSTLKEKEHEADLATQIATKENVLSAVGNSDMDGENDPSYRAPYGPGAPAIPMGRI